MVEIDSEKISQYYNNIMSGKITLTDAANQEGISREYLRKLITQYLENDKDKRETFLKRLHYNKTQNTAKEIDDVIMKNIKLFILGKINIQDASKECGIEEETFKNKVFEILEQDSALLELYLRNGANKRDYSQVNTRLIIINMLRNDMTQTEISRNLEIPTRTISGWVNKLPEDDELKAWAKEAAVRARHAIKLSPSQLKDLNIELDRYVEENNITQAELDTRSLEERQLEKIEEFLSEVYKLEEETDDNGKKIYTRKDIMRKLGVGMSAIRRAEIKRDNLRLIIEGKQKQELKGE